MNNEDRELLEMAAKAAGYKIEWWEDSQAPGAYFLQIGRRSAEWNPLRNDGDALRLAVKLNLDVQHIDTQECDFVRVKYDHYEFYEDYYGKDPYAATRRAIVRAAAEIGKTLK